MLNADFWQKYFRVYDVLNQIVPYGELLDEIVKEAKIRAGDSILDAGVGTGNLALLLEKEGARVVGLDFSEGALDAYKRKNSKASVVKADLTQSLPFEENYFDTIVSNNVLYNIPREKRGAVIREFERVLKPGGRIVLSNIHKNFKPIKIYFESFKKNIKKDGFLTTLFLAVRMSFPTIKMFYYNFLIRKAHKFSTPNLFDFEEQGDLFKKAGFINISPTKLVYAGQGILNSAQKR
jgi:ubiquinone/menaquinone biosynthesis C-methylase UbiE